MDSPGPLIRDISEENFRLLIIVWLVILIVFKQLIPFSRLLELFLVLSDLLINLGVNLIFMSGVHKFTTDFHHVSFTLMRNRNFEEVYVRIGA